MIICDGENNVKLSIPFIGYFDISKNILYLNVKKKMMCSGLSIFFKYTNTSLFTGGTFY